MKRRKTKDERSKEEKVEISTKATDDRRKQKKVRRQGKEERKEQR